MREGRAGEHALGLTALLLAAALQAGCASVTGPQSYPQAWAPLQKTQRTGGCPDITGTYANRASAASPPTAAEPPALTAVFSAMANGPGLFSPKAGGHTWAVPPDAVSVSFDLGPQSLTVRFDQADGSWSDLVFRRYRLDWWERRYDDQFTCYPGEDGARLRFLAEPEAHSTGLPSLYIEGGGTLVFLLKATDGALIVQWRSDSLALSALVLGTRMKFDSAWWRYPPQATGQ